MSLFAIGLDVLWSTHVLSSRERKGGTVTGRVGECGRLQAPSAGQPTNHKQRIVTCTPLQLMQCGAAALASLHQQCHPSTSTASGPAGPPAQASMSMHISACTHVTPSTFFFCCRHLQGQDHKQQRNGVTPVPCRQWRRHQHGIATAALPGATATNLSTKSGQPPSSSASISSRSCAHTQRA